MAHFEGDPDQFKPYQIIPLAVGRRPTDPLNQVLQDWNGVDGAHAKYMVEVRVKSLVCVGRIKPVQGQLGFVEGWKRCPRH
ncbi:hypothetical protein [Rhodoferax lacus]|nr:hypothetical protein [Rhodoferax lacus]